MANKVVLNKRTNVEGRKPSTDIMEYGEIALNYHKDSESIFFKNDNNEIVEFKDNKYYHKIIEDNELVTAQSLTQIKDNVGLGEDGSYTPISDSNYIGEAKTIVHSTELLDNALKNVEEQLNDAIVNSDEIYKNLVSVTYAELVTLRDNAELVPGTWYRVTDYVTTTSQMNTKSAGHQFDVLVLATDIDTLSEEARAIKHQFNIEDFKDAYSLSWGEKMIYNGTYEYDGKIYYHYKAQDYDNEGIEMLLDFNNLGIYELELSTGSEYPHLYYPTYSKYKDDENWEEGEGFGENICFKTTVDYFASSNLNAWKIWYSLDNDESKYLWMANLSEGLYVEPLYTIRIDDDGNDMGDTEPYKSGDIFIGYDYEENNEGVVVPVLYKSELSQIPDDPSYAEPDYSDKFFYIGIEELDGTEYDKWRKIEVLDEGIYHWDGVNKYYVLTERLVYDGEIIVNQSDERKGVIYRMIDEYGNDCPYDFKNIMFNRKLTDGVVDNENGVDTFVYTFSWIDIEGEVYDFSIKGNNGGLKTYKGEISGCYGNEIGYWCIEYAESDKIQYGLNDNVFISNLPSSEQYGTYNNKLLNDCYSNSFGDNCWNNSFGNDCYSNSFGESCWNNSFGNECYSNSFGDNCCSNSFGDNCYSNSFGNDFEYNSLGSSCNNNSFGSSCYSNSFGDNCWNNSFEGNCYNNSFGNECYSNSFGDNCYSNTFGNECDLNSFGNGCYSNSFVSNCTSNSFGDNCYNNSFDNDCNSNTFGNYCSSNSFGNECSDNSFGNECYSNEFGNECYSNSFGNSCESNSFGDNCHSNTFDNSCISNSFGNSCYSNSFGNDCEYNSFRMSDSGDGELRGWCKNNIFENGVSYVILYNTSTSSYSYKLQNVTVCQGMSGTSSNYNIVEISDLNADYQINVGTDEEGNVHIYTLQDFIDIEETLVESIDSIKGSVGLTDNLDYNPSENSNYISNSKNISESIEILDNELGNNVNLIVTTYSELVELRDNSKLIPGSWYRITDYVTTTSQANTKSAGHQFDVLVLATDIDTLSEEAKAIQHEGDVYFDEANLEAWKIWYSLDNDKSKFGWACNPIETVYTYKCTYNDTDYILGRTSSMNSGDKTYYCWAPLDGSEILFFTEIENPTENCTLYDEYLTEIGTLIVTSETVEVGKGVIYRMIDERNNDCPYDFKNMQFIPSSLITSGSGSDAGSGYSVGEFSEEGIATTTEENSEELTELLEVSEVIYYYTFDLNSSSDYSLTFEKCYGNVIKEYVNSNGTRELNGIVFKNTAESNGTFGNTFSTNCYNMEFGDDCSSNSFGDYCSYNSFGNWCSENSFGNGCSDNSFGNDCGDNSFGNGCWNNSFGNSCVYNSFGDYCRSNSFGYNCYSNTFGNSCYYNTFGNYCNYNSFSNYCNSNSLSDNCYSNAFSNSCDYNTFGNYCDYNTLGSNCDFNSFRMSDSRDGELRDYCSNNIFETGVSYVVLYNTDTASSSYKLQNVTVCQGMSGTSSNYDIVEISDLNANYQIRVAKDLDGNILVYNPDTNIIKTTYSELVELRDNGKLIPGSWYRITDYVTTTSQANTKSAGHSFDVLVLATDIDKLSEEAKAIQHEGDTYFDEANLEAWKIWYSLDNDKSKFGWADTTTGKGVIYRMIDERNNDCPYDFKNMQFLLSSQYYYTFDLNLSSDYSLTFEKCYGNVIKEYVNSNGTRELNGIVFKNITESSTCYSNSFGTDCYSNSFGNNCSSNTFGDNCYSNSFGTDCYHNSFGNYYCSNSFGNNCSSNTFGYNCRSNSFGDICGSNSFGDNCRSNSLGNNCYYNTFGEICYGNSFGDICSYNSFGNYCYSNSFGNDCDYNSFGDKCYSNTFGDNCYGNSFGNGCQYNSFDNGGLYNSFGNECYYNSFRMSDSKDGELRDYCCKNIFENGVSYVVLYNTSTSSSSYKLQNVTVCQGMSGTYSNYNIVEIPTLNTNYQTKVAKNTNGDIKVYCEADLIQ